LPSQLPQQINAAARSTSSSWPVVVRQIRPVADLPESDYRSRWIWGYFRLGRSRKDIEAGCERHNHGAQFHRFFHSKARQSRNSSLGSRNQGARNVLAGQGVQFLDRSPVLATSRPYLAIAATMVGIFFATQIVSNQIQSLSDKAKASAHGIYPYCGARLAPERRLHKRE
jgi:hypothetical protein